MKEKPVDRRTLRTKKLLRQALVELMEEHGLERITVSQLTERADVNRGTFYLHYKDVTDLLQQIQEEVLGKLSEIGDEIDVRDLMRAAERDEPYQAIVKILELWQRNADFCGLMLGPRGDPSFVLRVKGLMQAKLFDKLSDMIPPEQQDKLQVPREYLIAFVSSANVGVLQHWFASGCRQTPREVALIMTRLINYGPLASTGLVKSGGSSKP